MKDTLQPAAFVSHGSPMVAIETGAFQDALAAFGAKLAPKAILVISAHWDSRDTVSITASERNSLIYDFGGFPRELYSLIYDAPGSPALAHEVAALLRPSWNVELNSNRGLDHGAWIPLRLMFPRADIPVIELSIPTSLAPEQLFEMGRLLAPLRERGVMILGSGGIVHNLRLVDFRNQHGAPETWAQRFDQWVADAIAQRDYDVLFAYAKQTEARAAVPTPEHFVPIFVALGAAENAKTLETIFEGFEYGTLSMRSFALL